MSDGSKKKFQCPVDKRLFATRRALAQHKAVSHPNSGGGVNRAANFTPTRGRGRGGGRGRGNGRQIRSTQAESRTISGNDILGTSVLKTSTALGSVLMKIPVSPAGFAGTRLAAEAALWTRWRPARFNLQVLSSAGSVTSGQYIVCWSADPNEELSSGVGAIQRASAMRPSVTAHIASKTVLSLPTNTTQKWYMMEGHDATDTTHGCIFIILSGGIGNLTGNSSVTLTLRVNWSVTFYGPILPGTSLEEAIYAESDYADYFTTSTNDLNSGKTLICKAHSGGGCVPFPRARPQTVYKLDTGASLLYYKNDKDKAKVGFGVLIPNFYTKTFALFEEQNKAEKFAETGDLSHALTYVAACDRVEPDNPAWYETEAKVSKEAEDMRRRIRELEEQLSSLRASVSSSPVLVEEFDADFP